jgi:hypothetical protein
MEGQSAKCGIIMSALVCDAVTRALLGMPHTECFTEIFEVFAVEQRIRLQYS